MIEFALPWLLLLLPLPLLAWWLLPPAPEARGGALRIPFYRDVSELPSGSGRAGRGAAIVLTAKILAWCLLVVAAAQPRWIGEPRAVSTRGRDLMLAVDLSGSMEARDFDVGGRAVDRLTAVKTVARDFLRERDGDRVGLVLFGTRAYLQAPLTLDRATVAELLDESEIGLAGEETAIGDAIGLATKHLRKRPSEERVLVLLSDGASNVGTLDPIVAAELAAQEGVRIYTIGVGSDGALVRTPFGTQLLAGASDLDEETLAEVARLSGGSYFRARDTEALTNVYQQIDALEPTEGDAVTVRPMRALFQWPLGLALAIAATLAGARSAHDLALASSGSASATSVERTVRS